jgi:two-component system CheB/CheR fusion protein
MTEPASLRVLVVEDHADTAESTALFLRLHGHEVDVAPDGPAALRIAAQNPPDVALLDIGLPGGMDGWEVARRLQEQAAGKTPLLIAVTGYGQEEHHRRSEQAGIDLHLLKPFDPDALDQLLDRFKTIIGV